MGDDALAFGPMSRARYASDSQAGPRDLPSLQLTPALLLRPGRDRAGHLGECLAQPAIVWQSGSKQ